MSKRTKTLLAAIITLAVLAGILLAIYLLLPEDEDISSSYESSTVQLVSVPKDEIAKIEVKNKDGGFVLFLKDGEFQVEGYEGLPLNSDLVNNVVSQASSVQATEVIEDSPENLGIYGLDDPICTVTVTDSGGNLFSLDFGLSSSVSYVTYTKIPAQDTVYAVYNSNLSSFEYKADDFISKKITPDMPQDTEFASISYSGKNYPQPLVIEKYNFDEDDDATYSFFTYGITSPSLRPVDSETILGYVDDILDTSADSIIISNYTDEDLAQYGLDDPDTVVELSFSQEFEEDTVMTFALSFRDGSVYALYNDTPIIYTLKEEDWMSLKYEEIVHTLFILPSIFDVSQVTVETGGRVYDFYLSGENNEHIVCDGNKIESSAFSKFYQLLIGASNDGNYVPGTKPEGDPLLTITIRYIDDAGTDTMQFFDAGTRRLYVSVNGEVEFTMMSSYLEKVQEACEQIINGETPDSNWKV